MECRGGGVIYSEIQSNTVFSSVGVEKIRRKGPPSNAHVEGENSSYNLSCSLDKIEEVSLSNMMSSLDKIEEVRLSNTFSSLDKIEEVSWSGVQGTSTKV